MEKLTTDEKKKKCDCKSQTAGLVFVGTMFIGIGLGFYFHEIPIGAMLGMGVGFLAMALIKSQKK